MTYIEKQEAARKAMMRHFFEGEFGIRLNVDAVFKAIGYEPGMVIVPEPTASATLREDNDAE